MTVYSKVIADKSAMTLLRTVSCTCYEISHTNEPSCLKAIFDVFKVTFTNCAKMYILFYLGTSLLQKPWKEWKTRKQIRKLGSNTLRSSLFMSTHASMAMLGTCVTCHALGGVYGFHGLTNGFLMGYFLLDLESNSRNELIAIATAIWAAETLFRMLVYRKLMNPLPNGEVAVFCVASAGLMALFRSENLSKSMQSFLQHFLGNCEKRQQVFDGVFEKCSKFLPKPYHYLLKRLQLCHQSHHTCPHNHSCVHYVLEGFSRNILLGCGVDLILQLMQIIRGRKKTSSFLQRFSLSFFFGGYSLLFRACNCLLRWIRNKDSPAIHGAIAGAVAGVASWFYKSSTISLYFLFKLLEILAHKAVHDRAIPSCKQGYRYLYAVSLAIVLHSVYFEPHNTAPKFLKLSNDLSGGRWNHVFRKLTDVFGTNASTLQPDFVPTLDRRFVRTPHVIDILTAHGKLK